MAPNAGTTLRVYVTLENAIFTAFKNCEVVSKKLFCAIKKHQNDTEKLS